MNNNTNRIITIILIIAIAHALNIPLTKSRQTCLVITQGYYQFEYVVSGNSEKEVRCLIEENNRIILDAIGRSEYEGQFEVKSDEATICFSSLDAQAKSVSFDFIRTDDPLRGLIPDSQKMQVHSALYSSYQQLQKLYRDQHFFLQRNFIHQILLRNTQVALIFFLLLKMMLVFIAACFQLYFVKRILQHNYKPLASDQQKS